MADRRMTLQTSPFKLPTSAQRDRRSRVLIPHNRAALYQTFARRVRPPRVQTLSAWSDAHRMLTGKASSEIGRWRTERTPYLREVMDCLSVTSDVQRVVLRFGAQLGKALDVDTPIPTPEGWVRMGDVQTGNHVFDEHGRPVKVLFCSEVFDDHDCYRVRFSDGAEIIADAAHRWTLTDTADYRQPREVTLSTEQVAASYRHRQRHRYAVPVTAALDLPDQPLPIDPYTLGVWLGDGYSASAQVSENSTDAPEIIARIEQGGYQVTQRGRRGVTVTLQIDACGPREGLCLRGHILSEVGTYKTTRHGKSVHVCAECQRQHSKKSKYGAAIDPVIRPTFYSRLNAADLIGNKHIPGLYLRASAAQRMELLRGLMDTDGHVGPDGRNCEIASSYPALAAGIAELIRSLGFKPTVRWRTPKGGRESARIRFTAYADWPVFHLERKRKRLKSKATGRPSETLRRRIVGVDAVASRPTRCIAVDSPTHLYLAGEAMVPTHNTEVGLNWIGYVMAHAPAPMLVVVPTIEVRKRWVRQRLDPLLKETPAISRLFDARSQRDAGNSEDMKDFPGGILVLGGANSPASLAAMPIQYVLCDEVDRFPWEAGIEGDPLGLVEQRTNNFPRRKILLISTPTTAGLSRIDDEYSLSDQRSYQVPCPHCGERQPLRWRRDDGSYSLIRAPASGRVTYRCLHCEADIEEHHKPAMLREGAWVAANPGKRTRGYALNQLYSPIGLGRSWAELMDAWDDAHGDTAKLKRFINTSLGEAWEEEGDSLDPLNLLGRLEHYPEQRPPALRCAGVDVQKDRLEATIMDVGEGEECWVIDHLILPGDTALPEVWSALGEDLKLLRRARLGLPGQGHARHRPAHRRGRAPPPPAHAPAAQARRSGLSARRGSGQVPALCPLQAAGAGAGLHPLAGRARLRRRILRAARRREAHHQGPRHPRLCRVGADPSAQRGLGLLDLRTVGLPARRRCAAAAREAGGGAGG